VLLDERDRFLEHLQPGRGPRKPVILVAQLDQPMRLAGVL